MSIPLSLSGKVALITGGSRGIGAAAVRLFVGAGARVLFNYEKAKAPSEQLVKELGQENCAAMACNLSGTETAHELVSAAVKRFGRLDILVANHGVWPPEDAPKRGEAFHCDYAATKGALISMVKGLSTELARDAIYVNTVAPGWVDTDMSAPALNDPKTSARILSGIPLGRAGTPQEIAGPILFLCSEYAGFITGEVFNVNGGAVLVG